jgi:hypothetical protein
MKHLLLFLLCQGSLDGFSQTRITGMCWQHQIAYTDSCSKCVAAAKPDTVASHLLVSHKPPSFGHSIEGYCVVVGGNCTGKHLVWRRKRFVEIKPQYDVWRCIRKEVGNER